MIYLSDLIGAAAVCLALWLALSLLQLAGYALWRWWRMRG